MVWFGLVWAGKGKERKRKKGKGEWLVLLIRVELLVTGDYCSYLYFCMGVCVCV